LFCPIHDSNRKYNILQSAMAAEERVFKLLDTPAEIQEPEVIKKVEDPVRIEFDNVWFAYRNVPKDPSGTNGDVGQQLSSSDARPDRATSLRAGARGRPSPHGLSSTQTAPTGPDWVLRDVSFTI